MRERLKTFVDAINDNVWLELVSRIIWLTIMVYLGVFYLQSSHYQTAYACNPNIDAGHNYSRGFNPEWGEEWRSEWEYEQEYGRGDYGGRNIPVPPWVLSEEEYAKRKPQYDKYKRKHSKEHDVPPLPKAKSKAPKSKPKTRTESEICPVTETPEFLGGKPKVDTSPKAIGVFKDKKSTVLKKTKVWLTIRTYINSEGVEDPYCDVWIIKREGAVLQGILHGHTLQESAELIATHSQLPVNYEVLDFRPSRNSLNQPIDPEPFEDLD